MDKSLIKIDGIIFDLDGTLIDYEMLSHKALSVAINKECQDFSWEIHGEIIGTQSNYWSKYILEKTNLNNKISADDYIQSYFDEMNKLYCQLEAMPGAIELIEKFKQQNIAMSIATSSPRESYDKKMAYFPLIHDSMKVICTGNEIKNGKPDPDIFLLASHRMNIDPSKCIVFEDSPNGVLAAKSAGCFCVAIPDKRLPSNVAEKIKRAGADMILNSLNEFNFDLFEFK